MLLVAEDATSNMRGVLHQLSNLLLCLLAALCAFGCEASARSTRKDSVIPTPPVLTESDETATRIGVRALIVVYAGAKNAPKDVARSKREARERAAMVANIAQ